MQCSLGTDASLGLLLHVHTSWSLSVNTPQTKAIFPLQQCDMLRWRSKVKTFDLFIYFEMKKTLWAGNVNGQLFRVGPTVTVWDKDQWFVLHPFRNYPEYQARCTHGNRRGGRVGWGWAVERGWDHGTLPISLVHSECMSPTFNCQYYFSQPSSVCRISRFKWDKQIASHLVG